MADPNEGYSDPPLTPAELAQPDGNNPSDHHDSVTGDAAPLLPESETQDFRRQWDAIQTGFVDEPRRAVEQADELVASAMRRLAEVFSTERAGLESQWDRGDDVSTEELRIALQRYRAFFGRLLSI